MHPSWPCIMAVHQYLPCALSLWLVCLAHCILHRTFSIGLVFMATESPKMLVYYIPVSLNYSPCKYSNFFYFRYCFSVAQSSDFYCPNRAVPTTYYGLKIQRKFCLNLWGLFKCVFDSEQRHWQKLKFTPVRSCRVNSAKNIEWFRVNEVSGQIFKPCERSWKWQGCVCE